MRFELGKEIAGYVKEFPRNWKKYIKIIIILLISAVGSFLLIRLAEPVLNQWQQFGYLGVFLSSLAANATIILPAPLMSFTFPFAANLANQTDLFSVAVVYAAGATLGEGVGYLIGRGGKKILGNNNPHYQKAEGWLKKHGKWTIFVLSLQPIFPFDIVGIVAGTLKYSWWKFLIFCFLGRVPKYIFLIGGAFEIWKILDKFI